MLDAPSIIRPIADGTVDGVEIPDRVWEATRRRLDQQDRLIKALVTVPYVLEGLREGVPTATVTFDWRKPPTKPGELLVYEAFVTNQQNNAPNRHVRDAKLAIAAFRRGIAKPAKFKSSVTVPTGFNLLGAALLRTGWSTDIGLLSAQCLVVAPAAVAG